ncbi:MAG: DNA-binding response regulator [Actinobacteria bacterium HGW-Actinobacteria-7]|jgi:DNA-binding response OmpR family regulator|nr:MAG: DNA-binding response regulator [Actinobacteria bacterium HGW-Actinobacteria-7]
MSTILIVEDDPIIRQTVEYALKRAGFQTHSTGDGAQALELAEKTSPDLVLLDLMLPGMDGYQIAERLRATDKETGIIMVTALDTDRDKVRGLDAGADDYLTKPFSMDELLARVRANLRRVRTRGTLNDDKRLELGDLVIEPKSFRASVAGAPAKLRLKEFQLLHAMAKRVGQLCTREMLAEEVWGYEHMTSSRTIDVHIRRLRQAVEDPSAFTYIQTVHGMGYRFEPVPKDPDLDPS